MSNLPPHLQEALPKINTSIDECWDKFIEDIYERSYGRSKQMAYVNGKLVDVVDGVVTLDEEQTKEYLCSKVQDGEG